MAGKSFGMNIGKNPGGLLQQLAGMYQVPQFPDPSQVWNPQPNLQNVNPYLFFGNGDFAQDHPNIAGAMDNALGVLANMGPTSMSAGDNISNVARGLLGNRQQHVQSVVQQAMAPYALAGQMQDSMLKKQQYDTAGAESEYYRGRAKYYDEGGRPYPMKEDMDAEGYKYTLNSDGTAHYVTDPNGNKVKGYVKPSSGQAGPGFGGKTLPERLGAVKAYLDDPSNAIAEPEKYNSLKSYYSHASSEVAKIAGTGAGARKTAEVTNSTVTPAQDYEDTIRQGNSFFDSQVKGKNPTGDFLSHDIYAAKYPSLFNPQDPFGWDNYNKAVESARSTYRTAVKSDPSLTPEQHLNNQFSKYQSRPSAVQPGTPSGSATPNGAPSSDDDIIRAIIGSSSAVSPKRRKK